MSSINNNLKELENWILIILLNGEKDYNGIKNDPMFPKKYSNVSDRKGNMLINFLKNQNLIEIVDDIEKKSFPICSLTKEGIRKANNLRKEYANTWKAFQNVSKTDNDSNVLDKSKPNNERIGEEQTMPAKKIKDINKGTNKTKQRSVSNNNDSSMTIDLNTGDKTFKFRLTNGKTTIETPSWQGYRLGIEEFFYNALECRKEKLFGNVDVKELAKNYSFQPFRYQIENVETMLNRFEGKGVFGDQVGLGKTVEALMTAHAMFACGVIKNALLILPSKTIEGWKSEISSKFNGVFSVCVKGSFRETLNQIKIDRENVQQGNANRLYIVSSKMVEDSSKEISFVSRITSDLNRGDLEELNQFTNEILNCEWQKIPEKLIKYGFLWDEYTRWNEERRSVDSIGTGQLIPTQQDIVFGSWKTWEGYSINSAFDKIESSLFIQPTLQKYDRLIKGYIEGPNRNSGSCIFMSLKEKINSSGDSIIMKRFKINLLDFLVQQLKKSKEKIEKYIIESSRDVLAKDYIDLLIVDEVHNFYEENASLISQGNVSRNNTRNTIRKLISPDYVKLLASIKKKFCILISATPIRYQLSDIYDLCYIVDKDKLGQTDKDREEYFYHTVCQLDKEQRENFALSNMINDDEGRKRLFAMINGFFTRKRIIQVEEDMCLNEQNRISKIWEVFGRNEDYRQRLLSLRETMYRHTEVWDEDDYRKQPSRDYQGYIREGQLTNLEGTSQNNRKHFFAAVDLVLKGIILELHQQIIDNSNAEEVLTLKEQIRKIYSLIDWRRRKKSGLLIIPTSNELTCDQYVENYIKEQDIVALIYDDDHYEKVVEDIINDENSKYDFENAYLQDPVLLYVGRKFVNNIDVRERIKQLYSNDNNNQYNNRLCNDLSDENRPETLINEEITDANYNKIDIVGNAFQAGVNMQSYKTLVFMQIDQTDIEGSMLLEPVDIEQWIGRIYRTGQVKNCRIITILRTYFKYSWQNPDIDFLKWYYEILSDKDGFDLYGDTTPDVAFLQPIVTDIIKKRLVEKVNNGEIDVQTCKTKAKFIRNIVGVDIRNYSFAELLGICYYVDELNNNSTEMKIFVKDIIQDTCKIEGFFKQEG